MLIVVLVVKTGSPIRVITLSKSFPAVAVNLVKWLRSTYVKDRRSEVDCRRYLWNDLSLLGQAGISHNQWNANRRFVPGSFVDHSMFSFEQTVIRSEYDQRVVELTAIVQKLVETPDAVINRKKRAPVRTNHVCEILDGLRTFVGKLFSPVE